MGRISYSQLSMFSECPQRWKLNYIDEITESEPSIHLLFGTAMHEVIQTWLEVMYHDSVKNANKLNLEQRLHDKMMELFKRDKEFYQKDPCTLEEMREFFQDGVEILDFLKKRRADYFSKRGYKLIGCEVPIEVDLKKNVKIVGYLDLAFDDKGERISENIIPTPSKKACKWCEFNQTEYCKVGMK